MKQGKKHAGLSHIFKQINASKNFTKGSKKLFVDNKITTFDWPANS